MSKRREHHEEHENHERWLVTYADMVTLLMVLFIVMFAMSQVDQKKFGALKEGLAIGFGAASAPLAEQTTPLNTGGAADTSVSAMDPGIIPGLSGGGSDDSKKKEQAAVAKAVAGKDRAKAEQQAAAAQHEVEKINKVKQQIAKALAKSGET